MTRDILHRLSGHYNTLKMLWNLGGVVFIAFTFWLASRDKFEEILQRDLVHFILSVLLAFTTFVLFILWAISTHKELSLFGEYLREKDAPPLGLSPHIIILFIAIYLAFLINYSDNILVYNAIIISFMCFDIWGERMLRRIIKEPINNILKNKDKPELFQVALIMKKHYFQKPHYERIFYLTMVYWIAFTSALVGYLETDKSFRNLAYILVILSIVFGEIIVWRWRLLYYRELNGKAYKTDKQ